MLKITLHISYTLNIVNSVVHVTYNIKGDQLDKLKNTNKNKENNSSLNYSQITIKRVHSISKNRIK